MPVDENNLGFRSVPKSVGMWVYIVQYNLSTPAKHGTNINGRISQDPEYCKTLIFRVTLFSRGDDSRYIRETFYSRFVIAPYKIFP